VGIGVASTVGTERTPTDGRVFATSSVAGERRMTDGRVEVAVVVLKEGECSIRCISRLPVCVMDERISSSSCVLCARRVEQAPPRLLPYLNRRY